MSGLACPARAQQKPVTQTAHPTRPNYRGGASTGSRKRHLTAPAFGTRVFLIGDVGKPAPEAEGGEPSLNYMRKQILAAGPKSTTVYLGDNIYEYGLPE